MIPGLSDAGAYGLAQLRAARTASARPADGAGQTGEGQTGAGQPGEGQAGATQAAAQEQQLRELRRVDAGVRQHEAAHQAAGGPHAGGASFTFTRGPDGKNYAVAGEVPIDIGAEGSPAATIRKMDAVKAAALAPSDPSPQDLRVAQQADAQKLQAQQDLRRETEGAAPSAAMAAFGAAAYGAAQALGQTRARGGIIV